MAQLPALQVALPLAAAPLCALAQWRNLAWLLAMLASWATLAVSVGLIVALGDGGAISYELGGWPPPWGIEFRIDSLNALMLILVSGINAVVITAARASVAREIAETKHPYFYTAWMLCVTGLLGIAATGDAFNLFVFLEISSLATYILVASGSDRRALVAAFKYLIVGSLGATFFLIGVGLLYLVTGSLNLADIAERLPEIGYTRPVLAAAGFITVGLALKFALFPMHLWLPNAYTYAPSMASALLAATSTKISIYALLRFEFLLFQPNLEVQGMQFTLFLLPLAVLAFLVGSIAAIYQSDLKRLLAYSSVAQIGYIVFGVTMLSEPGLTGGIVHLFNHAVTKGALFLAVAALVFRYGSSRLADLAGCAREMPWTMGAFVIGGLSLIGVPGTAGFISKVYFITAALEHGLGGMALTALLLISSLLAVVYIWRVVELAYFRPRPAGAPTVGEAPLALLIPIWGLSLAAIYFGLETSLPLGLAGEAASNLLTIPGS